MAYKIFTALLFVTVCSVALVLANRQLAEPSPVGCEQCKQVVGYVQRSGLVGQYKDSLKGLCALCKDQDKCRATIDEWSKMLESETPDEVCQKIGLCAGPLPNSVASLISLLQHHF